MWNQVAKERQSAFVSAWASVYYEGKERARRAVLSGLGVRIGAGNTNGKGRHRVHPFGNLVRRTTHN
jgi:hypothetical protein